MLTTIVVIGLMLVFGAMVVVAFWAITNGGLMGFLGGLQLFDLSGDVLEMALNVIAEGLLALNQ